MAKMKVGQALGQIILGANIVTVVAMFVTGFSYLVDPIDMPVLSILGLVFPVFVIINIAFMLFWTFVRWRYLLVSFVALAVCYEPVGMYVGINRSKELPQEKIKVMSYNVLNFNGIQGQELRRDSNELVHYLVNQDCDIICLQEASTAMLAESQRALLASAYPHSMTITKYNNSQAIYSKFEILGADSIDYDSNSNFSMAYRLKTPHGEMLVINNHFESNHFSFEDKEHFGNMMHGKMGKHEMKAETKNIVQKLADAVKVRNPQAKAVAQYIEEHLDEKIILCGDFNEWPVSFTHHIVAQHLTDCFSASGQGLGWSYTHDGMRVRIDNIMCSKDIVPYGCYVDNSVHYSDHFPIISWLQIAR